MLTNIFDQTLVKHFLKLPPYTLGRITYSSSLQWQAETIPLDHAARALVKMFILILTKFFIKCRPKFAIKHGQNDLTQTLAKICYQTWAKGSYPNFGQNIDPNFGQNIDPNFGQNIDPNFGQNCDRTIRSRPTKRRPADRVRGVSLRSERMRQQGKN
jgi:hypothetical protein